MHKDDQMTPLERKDALARGEQVDRMPISIFYGAPAHHLLGWTRPQSVASPRNIAEVQKKVYEIFGTDGISVGYGLHGMGIAFGATMSNPLDAPPSILEHPLKDIHDLNQLDLGVLTIQKDPTAKTCYEAAQILKEELGHEVGCGMLFSGPFTSASALLGAEKLLKAIYHHPEQVHALLDFATKGLLQLAKPFLEMDMPIMVADPVASGTLLRQKHFQSFVIPYAKRFIEGCKAIAPLPVSCHICGDTSTVLKDIADCGYDIFSLDNLVDLAFAKKEVGDKMVLMGNVDPINEIHMGTPQSIQQAVRICFKKAWDSPKGFTISLGCDTPCDAPLENAQAFIQEARRCAQYPLDPKNFS